MRENELDAIFENAMYNDCQDISSSDIKEYINIEGAERTNKFNKRVCQGYEIIQSMNLETAFGEGVEVVLGHNPKAAAPYVTWVSYEWNDGFEHGHYFAKKENAVRDMFERGQEKAGLNFRREYQEELAQEDIRNVIEYNYGQEAADILTKNKNFMEMAIHEVDEVDHSAENEALFEAIEDNLKDWVDNGKVFDIGTMLKIRNEAVIVKTKEGDELGGKVCFYPEESLSEFTLWDRDEDGSTVVTDVAIGDISSIEMSGQRVFPSLTVRSIDEMIYDAEDLLEDMNFDDLGIADKDLSR